MKEHGRENIIIRTSWIGIITNLLIAGIKVVIGAITSSIAIMSEGVNNASDAVTSVLTLVGTKLAAKHPDEKHPFGYGRIEYLTGLVVAAIILVSGIEMLISSIKLVFNPSELSISYVSLVIIAASAVIKLVLGTYTIKKGKEAASEALIGVGKECRSDCIASGVTILSALVFLLFHISVDAYAGIITSLFIIWAGVGVLKETISEILGRSGEKELAQDIYSEIYSTPGIIAAADMMLHNYGPDKYSGSVNVEMDHRMSVGEIYAILHELQLRIMHTKQVTMVFGVYAVDCDHEEIGKIRRDIAAFINSQQHVKSFHALYLEPDTNKIYCDFIVDYTIKNWDDLDTQFKDYMKKIYPDSDVELTIETEYV